MELLSPYLVNLIAYIAIITGLVLGAWWIIAVYGVHGRKEESELPELNLPGHLHEVLSGIPPALVIFFAFVGISMIIYLLLVWLTGVTY